MIDGTGTGRRYHTFHTNSTHERQLTTDSQSTFINVVRHYGDFDDVVFLCIQACFLQSALGQSCTSRAAVVDAPFAGPCGLTAPAIAAPCGLAARGLAAPFGLAGPGLAAPLGLASGLAYDGLAYPGAAGYGAAAYGGAGEGNVAVAGELPVAGNTAVAGQVPIMGAVSFGGAIPAAGAVSISGKCACGCGPIC